jgi:methionine-rich copper-binding protein CopC
MDGLRGRTVTAAVLGLTVTAFALVATGTPALAHNSLTGSNPADGASLARPPAVVRLTFLARLDPAGTKVAVTGPGDVVAAGGRPVIKGTAVTVPFRAGPAGRYEVTYEVPSGDGHTVKGKVRFTLTVGAAAATTAPPTTNPVPATTAPATTAPAATAPATTAGTPIERVDRDLAADGADSGGAWWPWALAVALAVALLGGGYALSRRRS